MIEYGEKRFVAKGVPMTGQDATRAKRTVDADIMLENAISDAIGDDVTWLCRNASKYKFTDFKRLMLMLGYPAVRRRGDDEDGWNVTGVLPSQSWLRPNAVMNACLVTRWPFLLRGHGNPVGCEDDDGDVSLSSTWLDDMPIGWKASFGLEMCEDLSAVMGAYGIPTSSMVMEQVKEKYGSIRWYHTLEAGDADPGTLTSLDDDMFDVIWAYEALSARTCVRCGIFRGVRLTRGYVLPVCRDCHIHGGDDETRRATRRRAVEMYVGSHAPGNGSSYVPECELQGYYDRIFVDETDEVARLGERSAFVVRTHYPDGRDTERNILDTCERHGLLVNRKLDVVRPSA